MNTPDEKMSLTQIHGDTETQTLLYLFDKQLENRRHFHCNFIHSEEQSPKRQEEKLCLVCE